LSAALAVISVFLVEPLAFVREALADLLDSQSDIHVGAAVAAVEQLPSRLPQAAILLLCFERLDDRTWGRLRLLRSKAGLRIVFLTTAEDLAFIARAFLEGASGLVHKRANPAAVLAALRRVAAGDTIVVLPDDEQPRPVRAGLLDDLSARELQILQLVANEMTSRQVSSALGLSERTVTTHLQNAYKKLGAHSRLAAVDRARQQGYPL